MFELRVPELTTVIRWCLRFVLVLFLAWLVRRRPEDEEEEEEEPSAPNDKRASALRARQGQKGNQQQGNARIPRPRDPYATTTFRQRAGHGDGNFNRPPSGQGTDFDDVIAKISKPRDMWEVRKPGESIQVRRSGGGAAGGDSPYKSSLGGLADFPFDEAPKQRVPLKLNARNHDQEAARKLDEKRNLHAHTRPVTWITWNLDSNLLFTCGKDKRVCVWSFPESECLGTYEGHNGAVWSCGVTADSKWLVSAGADRLVIVWEARTSKELARVELPGVARFCEWATAHAAPGASAEAGSDEVAPVAERFVTCHNRFGSQPAALTIWRFDGTAIEQLSKIDLKTTATQVRWGKGDEVLASAHEGGELIFWNVASGEEVRRLQVHDTAVSKFEFNADRDLVGTCGSDHTVKLWDLGEGSEGQLLFRAESDRPLNDVALGPLKRSEAIGPVADRPLNVSVIAAGGQDVRDVTTTSSTTNQFETILFRLGLGESDPPNEMHADGTVKGHFGPVHTLGFAPDGTVIASGSEDGCVRLHCFADYPSPPRDSGVSAGAPAVSKTTSSDQLGANREPAVSKTSSSDQLGANRESGISKAASSDQLGAAISKTASSDQLGISKAASSDQLGAARDSGISKAASSDQLG